MRTEQEILEQWDDRASCTVSVCMLAYNHESYVDDALQGVLSQETDFPIEILIHDDASTDRTTDIIKAYAARYPRIIRPIYQEVNQHARGVKVAVEYLHPMVRGDYVANCECDDWWTDNQKLARQIDAMQHMPECDLCFHPARQVDCSGNLQPDKIIGRYRADDGVVSAGDVVLRTHGLISTASCVLTRRVWNEYVDFRKGRSAKTGDIYMQFLGACRHGAIYLNEVMSAYRWQSPGSWTRGYNTDPKRSAAHEWGVMKAFSELDDFTEHRYPNLIQSVLLIRFSWYLRYCQKADPERFQQLYKSMVQAVAPELRRLARGSESFIVYGTGLGVKILSEFLSPDRVISLIDRDESKQGLTFHSLPVTCLSSLPHMGDYRIIIALFGRTQTVLDACAKMGISDHNRFISMDPLLFPLLDELLASDQSASVA